MEEKKNPELKFDIEDLSVEPTYDACMPIQVEPTLLTRRLLYL